MIGAIRRNVLKITFQYKLCMHACVCLITSPKVTLVALDALVGHLHHPHDTWQDLSHQNNTYLKILRNFIFMDFVWIFTFSWNKVGKVKGNNASAIPMIQQ